MSMHNLHKTMILQVAKALGPELCEKVAFVGGSTTGLFTTDQLAKEQVRDTDDKEIYRSRIRKPTRQ